MPVETLQTELPLVSFLLPVDGSQTDPSALKRSVESVVAQTYPKFELCLTIDGEPSKSLARAIPKPADRTRVHFRQTPMGRAASLDDGLRVASGRYIALLDPGDELAPNASAVLHHELTHVDDVDLLFTDEDEVDTGRRTKPFYKPGFSPERFRQQMYLGALLVCRRTLAIDIGGFASCIAEAEDYDFALRASEEASRIAHVPQVLYHRAISAEVADSCLVGGTNSSHRRAAASDGVVQAVQDHLNRTGFSARPTRNRLDPSVIDLEPDRNQTSPVSIIIPTGGATGPVRGKEMLLVTNAISSVVAKSTYENYEFVVVLDQSSTEKLASDIRSAAEDRPLSIVRDSRAFNFSKACNLGAIRSSGEACIFLNDDTEVRSPDWIERLTMYATRYDVGAVGAKLLYGDDRIQQVGIWSRHGHPLHRYVGFGHDHPGNRGSLLAAQNCLAVTGACLAVEKEKFFAVGGFTPIFPLSFNDVDLCLKLSRHGFRTVVDGATTMYHFEAMSRDPSSSAAELEAMHRRWEIVLRADPYDNPNHRTDGVEELPLPSDSLIQFDDREANNYLGRHWPPLSNVLQC